MERESAPLPEGTVTVLFTDLVGSTFLNQQLGDEAASALEREIEREALDQVQRHRGVLVKDTGDGLMAAFQSARRAVGCAREIQRALSRRNRERSGAPVQMRIGLHTGEVIEESGNLHGETVIIAKRVESLAPAGAIFASETVFGVLGTAREELEDRGQFELKGISAPWRLYEVPRGDEGGGPLADQERTPFVGRAAERERLHGALARAAEGQGGLVLVSGEAGAGKTRLAQEAAAAAERRGMAVLVGQCLDMDAPPPYRPVIEHIQQAARGLGDQALREVMGENAPELAVLMPELRQTHPDIPEPPSLPPEQERRYLLHGVGEFVVRAARARPLVLVYEDLHWADESTLLLLHDLAPRLVAVPVLVIGTYRQTGLSPERPFGRVLEAFLRSRQAEELVLSPLGARDVAALLQGRAGQAAPAGLVDLVYSETEGNPFFVEEVFRHLKESGKLFDEAGRWREGIQIADADVPRGVALVIGRRLDGVSEASRRALTAAAVAGRLFSFELLLEVAHLDENELLDALEEAERAHLIEDRSEGREARYVFVHEQIRQVLLSGLSVPRRQRLHLRIADALERGGAAAPAAELAHHLYRAGTAADPDRTLAALRKAAERSLASLAFEDVLRHVDAAMGVLEERDATARCALLALRARAQRGAGRIDDALATLAEGLAVAPQGDARDAVQHQRAQLRLDLFRGREALDDLAPLLERAREAGERARILALLLDLGRAHYILSLDDRNFAAASRDSYEEAYALARELGDRHAMARALIPTVWFTDYWQDYHATARANAEEATALAAKLGDEGLQIDADTARLRVLPTEDALAEAERLRDALEARRDPVRLKENLFWLMWQYWSRGELEKCIATCDRGIELAAELGSAPVQYGSIKALALADLGRFDQVEAALAQEVADDAHPFGRCMRRFAEAEVLERLEAWDAAVEAARDAFERAGRLSRAWMQSWLVGTLASLCARMGERGAGLREDLGRAAAAGIEPSSVARAELDLAGGDPQAALTKLEPALAGLERLHLRGAWLRGGELRVRALLAAGRPQEAAEQATAALGLAAKLGMAPLAFRLHAGRARALDAAGDGAAAAREREAALGLLEELAARISDPSQRAAFEAQPLARGLRSGAAAGEDGPAGGAAG